MCSSYSWRSIINVQFPQVSTAGILVLPTERLCCAGSVTGQHGEAAVTRKASADTAGKRGSRGSLISMALGSVTKSDKNSSLTAVDQNGPFSVAGVQNTPNVHLHGVSA